MDYEFQRDLTGGILARFSMDHEAIGYWLNDEIQGDISLIDQIFEEMEGIKGSERQWELIGKEYSLSIDDEEVIKDFDVINDSFPTIYRIDRIKKLKVLEEQFHIPYSSRFEEGEFRKRVQFMFGGKLQKVKFKYYGENIEAVLDRLPTAKILSEENDTYIVVAEVFGKGIDMWFKSQGDNVEIISLGGQVV